MANEDKVPRLYVKGADGEFHEVMLGDVTVEEIQDDEIPFPMVHPATVIATGWIVLGAMKLAGLIDIAWGWVMCPVWLPLLSILAMRAVLLAIAVTEGFVEGIKSNADKT